MIGTWSLDWILEIGLELGAWIGTLNSDWKLELVLELGAWNLEIGLELGTRFGIGAWSLDWVLKLGGLKHLTALKPCYATWRPLHLTTAFLLYLAPTFSLPHLSPVVVGGGWAEVVWGVTRWPALAGPSGGRDVPQQRARVGTRGLDAKRVGVL